MFKETNMNSWFLLRLQNPESLDLSIQTALSALFPPFEVTAPIVISQLFRTIEERYSGDALQCLLDFLIPSKHLLESVQQAACAGYSDVVFRCEGWPLCLHDKTVIQLAPVNPLLLRPGDFYFQVEPFGDQAARIVLKSLLEEGCREVEETPIPETSYPCIFTEDWLNDINEGRHGTALSRCLLCTDQGVIKLPWAKIAIPEFLDRPRKKSVCGKTQTETKPVSAPSQFNASTLPVGAVISPKPDNMSASLRPVQSRLIKVEHERRVPKLGTKPLIKPVGWVSPNTWESPSFQGMEGDYVDLVDISKGKQCVDKQRDSCEIQNKLVSLQPVRPPPPIPLGQRAICRHAPQHAEDPCNPCSQMQPGQELSDPDLKCRYRESYLEALSNPVAFERGGADLLSALEEVHLCEEGDGKAMGAPEAPKELLENICNGLPVVCSESCQCNLKKLLTPENLDCHRLSSPEPEVVPKETVSNVSVQTEQAPQQFGSAAVVHPPPDVTPVTCDAALKPHQMGEAVKSSKHKVKGRSLSTVSETPAGSPVLYQLNSRSHSDVCPETIANLIHGRKGARPDQQAGRSERHKGSRKEFRSSRSETPSFTNELSAPSCGSQPNLQTSESAFSGISSLLELGIMSLPGSRDRNGRAVVEVHGDREEWMSPLVSAQSVCELLLYLHSIPRKDVRELGITLLINARKRPPPLHLYKALLMAQEQALHAVHCIILLMDKDTCPRPEKHPGLQIDMVTSLRALNKTVEASQVTSDLGGTFIYSHTDWLQFHRKLVSFMDELRGADSLLQMAIKNVDSRKQMDTTQEVQQSIQEQKILMKNVLEDARLVTLQREGGALLARMKREEFRFPQSEDYRDALESVTSLYNQVEEKLHTLVMRSNESLQHLEVLLKIRETEAEVITAGMWFSTDGEQTLKDFCTTDDTDIKKSFQDFSLFLALSKEKQQHALTFVKEAEEIIETRNSSPAADIFRTLVSTFKSNMEDFMLRAERRQKELSSMVQVYMFCEQASTVAKECAQFVEQVEEGCLSAQTLSTLQLYKERLGGEFSDSHFQALRAKACTMGSGASGMMKMWNAARVRCQEVKQRLEETQRKKRGKDKNQIPQTAAGNPRGEETQIKGRSELKEAEGSSILQPICQTKAADTTAVPHSKHVCKNEAPNPDSESLQRPEPLLKNTQVSPQVPGCHPVPKWRPRDHRSESDLRTAKVPKGLLPHHNLGRSLSEGSRATSMTTFLPAVIRHNHCHSRTQSLDENMQPNHNPHQESPPPEQKSIKARGGDGKQEELTDSCKDLRSPKMLQTPKDNTSNVLRVRKILQELLSTEREYVKALAYVREHYFPELERPDVPQDLRGQRGSVFGNLEKLHDFHHHHFLDELESCLSEPLRVGRCFLRHRESFALYALYSKNKPQSDSLLVNHGHGFFKQKQLKLGDKMDLWSYLLKPVQRISKYGLLLQDMMRECAPDQTREISEIKAAMEVINFQLRHGNNLLAMDAIRHCDVNLKEQGQLLRQDEFTVTFRKKRCCRHVFLFQELVLFSKTRKTDSGNDTYIYKQSFKTSDIGMTQNSGDSGLCFEIWFRKRKSEDTYTLQAASRDMKEAWTRELEQILWEQAIHNREVRMQERVFLGIGNKPFIDIQPSEAAIHDRAINYALMGRENKVLLPCGSKVQPSGARPKSLGSGSSSASSSSSGRGSLSPEGYARLPKRRVVSDGGYASPPGSLEEDDLDQESSSHNLLLDSSESSGESICGFSSSGHSFQSAVGGEMDETSSVCASTAPKKTQRQAEALVGFSKANAATGPAVKTQPPVAPKPKPKALHWNKDPSFSSKVQDTGAGKSTEV